MFVVPVYGRAYPSRTKASLCVQKPFEMEGPVLFIDAFSLYNKQLSVTQRLSGYAVHISPAPFFCFISTGPDSGHSTWSSSFDSANHVLISTDRSDNLPRV